MFNQSLPVSIKRKSHHLPTFRKCLAAQLMLDWNSDPFASFFLRLLYKLLYFAFFVCLSLTSFAQLINIANVNGFWTLEELFVCVFFFLCSAWLPPKLPIENDPKIVWISEVADFQG